MDGFNGTAAEASHRIANDLALIAGLIRFQAANIPEGTALPALEVRGLLQNMSSRIEAVARLHRLLTQCNGEATIDLGTYLQEIANAAALSIASRDLTEIAINLEPMQPISARQATTIGLIVGEAITNALKYAHPTGVPGAICITSRCKGPALAIEVADDGVGLPEDFDPDSSDSVGVRLMSELAKQLNAQVKFERRPIGLCVRLDLPLFAA